MQHRMKEHQLHEEEIRHFLDNSLVGRVATLNEDGYPYITPVHFIYYNDKIYFHGLPKGQKLTNIENNAKVSFEVDEMIDIIIDSNEVVCDTNTEYNSVIITGNASILTDLGLKEQILNLIVEKLTPQFKGRKLPDNMIKGTAVVEISCETITGKYYK